MLTLFDELVIIIDDLGETTLAQLQKLLPSTSLQQISSVLGRLAQRGWLKRIQRNGHTYVRLESAADQYLSWTLDAVRASEREWDGRWFAVVTHVPEERRKSRDVLRVWLSDHGFGRLIDGFWISPRDRSDEVHQEAQRLGIAPYLYFLTIETLGQATLQRLIQTMWDWKRIEVRAIETVRYLAPLIDELYQTRLELTQRRLTAKRYVFIIADTLVHQPNLPKNITPTIPAVEALYAHYQRLRPLCYQ